MKIFGRKLPFFVTWMCTPAVAAFILVLAVFSGVDHPWLPFIALALAGAAAVAAVYVAGICVVIYESSEEKSKSMELLSQSFTSIKKTNARLYQQLDQLSEMREIQVSSHMESFSDCLKNILTVTRLATDATSMTIYMENQWGVGPFPKAHMHWRQEGDELPGDVFMYFEEELPLSRGTEILEGISIERMQCGDESQQAGMSGVFLVGGSLVGSLHCAASGAGYAEAEAPAGAEAAKGESSPMRDWFSSYRLHHYGVLECWQTRRLISEEHDGEMYVTVPIISQQLTIGVLMAQFQIPPDREAFLENLRTRKMDILKDRGRTIGYPLKKEALYELSTKDSLTGLFNKAHYETQLRECFNQMVRYNHDLSLIYIDLDYFKKVNDTYGHLAGDRVLKGVAKLITQNIRKSDMAFRIGGEELAVLLVETPLISARGVAEKLRSLIEDSEFPVDEGGMFRITASFGVSHMVRGMASPIAFSKTADDALYLAKNRGRNRIEVAES